MADKGKWLITKNPLKTFGLNDLGESFKSNEIIPALVRESVQNGLDAKADGADHVTMKFGYRRIDPNELPGALTMKRVFTWCRDFPGRSMTERKFFEKGLGILGNTTDKMGMLSISDYGTCGLRGAKTNANGSRFKGLVMTSGAGNDDGSRGGGFGLGKEAMYLASKLRTIFFSTVEDEPDEKGYAAHMGVGCLATFNNPSFDGNRQADRNIFFCTDDFDPDVAGSVPSIPGVIKFSDRKAGECGTDVYIPGFEAETDVEKLSAGILGEVLKSFLVSVSEGMLEVVLPNGKAVTKKNLGQMVDWYKHFAPAADRRLVTELYKLTAMPWKHSDAIMVDHDIDNFPTGAFDYKFVANDENINVCLVTREKGMVVHTMKDVCGTTSAVGFVVIRDKGLNPVFKKMENARHDCFKVTTGRFPDKDSREIAKKQLKKLEESARKWAEAEAGVKIVDTTQAELPDELDELMDICAGQFAVDAVKAKSGKKPGIGGVRVKRHKKKKTGGIRKAVSAHIGGEGGDELEPGHKTGNGKNRRERGNPVVGRKRAANPNSPEANGFVLRPLLEPTFYAAGKPETGRYRFSFKVPKSMPKVCACFSSTAENDGREALSVKSVTAKCAGAPVVASPDLENTVVSFENVSAGQVIDAEIEFDVSHYCYSEVRYYEKKISDGRYLAEERNAFPLFVFPSRHIFTASTETRGEGFFLCLRLRCGGDAERGQTRP